MRSTLLISFFLALVCQCLGADFLNVVCDKNGDMILSLTVPEPAARIFADTDPDVCFAPGNSALTIPIGGCKNARPAPEGVVDVTYMKIAGLRSDGDKHFKLNCTTDALQQTETVNTGPKGVKKNTIVDTALSGNRPPTLGDITLTFTDGSNQPVAASVTVGHTVRLQITLTSDTIHTIVPWKCVASISTPTLSVTMVDDRCSEMTNVEESVITDDNNSTTAYHQFKAFGLGSWVGTADQSVTFTCDIQVCGRKDTELFCKQKTKCHPNPFSPRRRRRAAANERGAVTLTSQLRVHDPSKKSIQEASNTLSTSAVATIGSSAGAVFILLSAFFIVLAVRIRRRKQKNADEFTVSRATEVSQTPVGDHFFAEEGEGRDQEVGVVNSAYENTP